MYKDVGIILCNMYIADSIHQKYNNNMVEVYNMPVSKAQQKATSKYIKNNYDRLEMKVKKGQKEIIVEHAKTQNENLNQFLIRAVNLALQSDNYNGDEITGTASSKIE